MQGLKDKRREHSPMAGMLIHQDGNRELTLRLPSNREVPGIPRMRAIDDAELDAVRLDILAPILLPGCCYDLAVLQLAAVRKTFRDIFVIIRVDRAALLRSACGLIDIVRDKTGVMQPMVAKRLMALLIIDGCSSHARGLATA